MVTQTSILICDEDRAYVDAVVTFLMTWEALAASNVVIVHYSSEKEFETAKGTYDLALMGSTFIRALSKEPERIRVKRLLCLSEESVEEDDSEFFYKYQSMEKLIALITSGKRLKGKAFSDADSEENKITCIFAPGGNDLSIPFALSMCRYLSETEEVLFVDLEEPSILSRLMERDFGADLIDLIYMLDSEMEQGIEDRFVFGYEGFSMLVPSDCPGQLSYVSEEQWKRLIKYAFGKGFNRIVFLFGSLVQGSMEIVERADSVIVIKRHGEFGTLEGDAMLTRLEKMQVSGNVIKVELPFSSHNLAKGSYRLETLINGKMLEYVRKEF